MYDLHTCKRCLIGYSMSCSCTFHIVRLNILLRERERVRETEAGWDWHQSIYRTILHGCHPVTRSFPNVLDPRISSSFKSTYMLSFRLADIDMCMCMCAHALAFGIIHTHV